MAENREIEDLDHLVNSEGWRRFVEMVDRQWGRNSDTYHDAVSNAAKGDNAHMSDHLRQILAAQREILKVLDLPKQRLATLKKAEQHPVLAMSRRGGL